jgi:hypothetical protein
MSGIRREHETDQHDRSPENISVITISALDAFEKTEEILDWLREKKDLNNAVVVATPDSSSFASFVAVSLYKDFAVFPLNLPDEAVEISSEKVSAREAIDPDAAEELHYLLDHRDILVILMGNTSGRLKAMIGEFLQSEYQPEKCFFVALYESIEVPAKVDFAAGLTDGFPILETKGEGK